MIASPAETKHTERRVERLLARVRRKQLDHALHGRIAESAHYTDWARRLRQLSASHRV